MQRLNRDKTALHVSSRKNKKSRTKRGKIHPKIQMHRPGIEPGLLAWKAKVIPLDHRCAQATLVPDNIVSRLY